MNLICAVALLMAQMQANSTAIPTVDEFRQESVAARRAILDRALANREPLTAAIGDLFAAGLDDSSRDVRYPAILNVSARAFMLRGESRIGSDPALEEKILSQLRPRLLGLFRDADEGLRLETVRAAGTVDLAVSTNPERLSAEFTQSIIAAYATESSPRVKIEIVKALASDGLVFDVQAVLMNALTS